MALSSAFFYIFTAIMKNTFLFFLFFPVWAFAQTIDIEFPKFAGKTFDFIIFQGDKQVKLYENQTIPPNGLVQIIIPPKYAPYTGMCRWLITNTAEGGGLDMAIPGHGFKVSCFSDQPNENNIHYVGYDAVNELNRLNKEQQLIIDKFETMSKATMLYDKTHPSYATFTKEKKEQELAFEKFQQDLKLNTNYNARFLPIVNLTIGIAPKLTDNNELSAQYVNDFIVNELNYEDLYTSGHWAAIINSWVQIQTMVVKNDAKLIADVSTILNRIKSNALYTEFVINLTKELSRAGKDDALFALIQPIKNSKKLLNYEGVLNIYKQDLTGKAPDLIIKNTHREFTIKTADLKSKQTLLLFYNSGCGACETTIQSLITNYATLKAKGLKIIALSSDTDETEFKTASASFPWKETYCDLAGMNGVNFKSYAIIGTPTMYLLDSKGMIVKKLATADELMISILEEDK